MVKNQLKLKRYTSADAKKWNEFIGQAKNATFLHHRDFLGHHSDLFEDHSIVFNLNENPIALFPANAVDSTIQCHGGLTYGGIITSNKMTASLMLEVVECLIKTLKSLGFERFQYKPVPHIFCKQPADEDIFALMQHGLELTRCDLSFAIPLNRRLPFSTLRKRMAKKASKLGVTVKESSDLSAYWKMLNEALQARHNTKPTHNYNQISYLQSAFPKHIRLFASFHHDEMIAGVLIFDCGQTIHAQYIVASEDGLELGALDLLFQQLINNEFSDRNWFNFGSSTEDQGSRLNHGLARQKEMFGARSIAFQHFELNL